MLTKSFSREDSFQVFWDCFSLQAASTAEEAPTETAVEESGEAGEDGAPEGMAETGGRGRGKKEAGSSKSSVDGKLVKGSLSW